MAREADKSARESSKSKIEDEDATGSKGADSAGSRTPASKSGGQEESGKGDESDIAEFQSGRHRELEFVLAKRSEATANPRTIVEEFAAVWLPHHLVEAEVLAPALEDAGFDEDKMAAVKVRKDIVNMLLADLIETRAAEFAMAKLDALADALAAVIQASDEERERVSEAMGAGGRGLSGLGSQMKARYERVKGRFANLDKSIGEAMDMLAPRSLSVPSGRQRRRMENDMPRYSNTPDRDEHGRFLPDDDREHSRGYRGGRERDEAGRFMSERGFRGGPERDEAGRFMSEGGSRSRSRYEDEDERYGGRRSMGRDYDDDERLMRRDEGRGHGGWFGDPEGHSEASRRGWERSGHGESGWFGDPEGHSEAARRRWEGGHEGSYRSRSRYDDDDRRGGYESRHEGRYYDDERGSRGRSGGGHGGWSGDSEGHAEAARRGWERRR